MGFRRARRQLVLRCLAVMMVLASSVDVRADEGSSTNRGATALAQGVARESAYVLARRRELAVREELVGLPADAPEEKRAALRQRLLEAKKKRVEASRARASRAPAEASAALAPLDGEESAGGVHPVWYAVLVIAAGIGVIAFLSRRSEESSALVIERATSGTLGDSTAAESTSSSGVTGSVILRACAWPLATTLAAFVLFASIGSATGLALPIASAGALGLVAVLAILSRDLVADYVKGKVIAIERPFEIGDVVSLTGTSSELFEGTIEEITPRTTLLRDFDGSLHHITHGRIATISNCSTAWTRSVTDVRVAYSEDVDQVVEIIRRAADDARIDPLIGKLIAGDDESVTIDRYESYGAIIRLSLRTRPLREDRVRAAIERSVTERCRIASIDAHLHEPGSSLDA